MMAVDAATIYYAELDGVADAIVPPRRSLRLASVLTARSGLRIPHP